MGNSGESNEMHCVFVTTSRDTRLGLLLQKDDNVSAFKEKLCKEHRQCFPEVGEITISALKVEFRGHFYHLSDSMILSKAFEGVRNKDWFIFVDVLSA